MRKKELKVDIIYHLSKIGIDNLKLCVIESNRKDIKQILAKKQTCEEVGMQVPAIVTDAIYAFDAGYTLIDVQTSKKLTREEAEEYILLVEGNTRFWAFLEALDKSKKDPGYQVFDYIFQYREYTDAESFKKAYRQINQYNEQTTGKDFARDLLATSPNEVLKCYMSKVNYGMLPKAAGLATVCKEIDKKDIEKGFAASIDKLPTIFSETQILEYTSPIYESLKAAFGSQKHPNNLIKTVPLWNWIAIKLNSATDRKVESKKLTEMFDNLNSRDAKALENAQKQENKKKGDVIVELLDNIYKKN